MNFRIMTLFTVCLLSLMLVLSHSYSDTYDPTNDLITAFCEDCIGEHTQSALDQSQYLIQIIESMRNDDHCQDVYSNLLALYDSLQQFSYNADELELRVSRLSELIQLETAELIQTYEDQYVLANPSASQEDIETALLNYTPGSTLLSTLNSEYAQTRIDLLDQQLSNNFDYTTWNRKEEWINQITIFRTNVEHLFSSLKSSIQCRENHANLIAQVGARILGTAGTMEAGIIGTSLMGLGVFASGTSELIREIKYSSNIRRLQNARLNVALGCSLEGIAKTYCQSRDTQVILEQSQYMHQAEPESYSNLYRGIDIITQMMPVYNLWIQQVLAGADPSNQLQANQKIDVHNLRYRLDTSIQRLEGVVNEMEIKIQNLAGSQEERNTESVNIRLNLMNQVSQFIINEAKNNGPYSNSFISDVNCGPKIYVYSLGAYRVKIGTDEEQALGCNDYINKRFANVLNRPHSISQIRTIVERINAEARRYVNRELQQVLEDNADLVLAYMESMDPEFLKAPKDIFSECLIYLHSLRHHLNTEHHYYLIQLIDVTLWKLMNALDLIDQSLENNGTEAQHDLHQAAIQITELGLLLAPNQQTLSISNAIREIVKQHLDIELRNDTIDNEDMRMLLQIIPENRADFIINNHLGMQRTLDDTAYAKNITRENLIAFGNVFRNKLFQRLRELFRLSGDYPYNNDIKRELGLLCIQCLLIPDDSSFYSRRSRRIQRYCENTVYASSLPNYIDELSFDRLKDLRFEDRVCTLYDYRREISLYEMFEN